MENDRLLQRVRDGDPAAGPVLVSVFGRRLMHYVNLIAPHLSAPDREMLAESAVEAAVTSIHRFDSAKGTFDAWLRGFARTKLLEHRRLPQLVAAEGDELDAYVFGMPRPPVPIEGDAQERYDELSAAMLSLSATDQLIIGLRDINGFSYAQIGEMLHSTPAACRQRHRRAITRLRETIERGTDEPEEGRHD